MSAAVHGSGGIVDEHGEAAENRSRVWMLGRLGDDGEDDFGAGEEEEERDQGKYAAHQGLEPTLIQELDGYGVSHVSVGLYHAAAATPSGHCYTWGGDQCGQLGRSRRRQTSSRPAKSARNIGSVRQVPAMSMLRAYGGPSVCSLSCGGAHTAVLCGGGVAYGFGSHSHGQLGLGCQSSPPGRSRDRAMGTGEGERGWWQYGIGVGAGLSGEDGQAVAIPWQIRKTGSVCQVSCGGRSTYFLTQDGSVLACGDGSNGRLGDGSGSSHRVPTRASFGGDVGRGSKPVIIVSISAGWAHAMAISDEGLVYTWGCGINGRLGLGNVRDCWRPRTVCGIDERAIMCSAGYEHSAVCVEGGGLWTWGLGERGQLGVGNLDTALEPVKVMTLAAAGKHITKVACGGGHTACVTSDGHLLTWGRGDRGQLGHGDRSDRMHCKVVRGLESERVVSVACGWASTIATACSPEIEPSDFRAVGVDEVNHEGCRVLPLLPGVDAAACLARGCRASLDVSVVHRGVRYYSLSVSIPGGGTWRVNRRYRQFRGLIQELNRRGIAKWATLPPRRFGGLLMTRGDEEDEERFQHLQACIDAVLLDPKSLSHSATLQFLEVQSSSPSPCPPPAAQHEGEGFAAQRQQEQQQHQQEKRGREQEQVVSGVTSPEGGIGTGSSGADNQRELPPPLWPGGTLLPGLIDEFTTSSKQPSTVGASIHRPAISGADFPGLASPPRQRRGGSGGHKDGDEREGEQVHGGGEGAGLHEWGSILPSPGDAGSRRSRDSDSRKGGGHRAADGGVWGGLAFWVGKGIGAWELQTKGMRARELRRRGGLCGIVRCRAWAIAIRNQWAHPRSEGTNHHLENGSQGSQHDGSHEEAHREALIAKRRVNDDVSVQRRFDLIHLDVQRTLEPLGLFQAGCPLHVPITALLEGISFRGGVPPAKRSTAAARGGGRVGGGYVQGMSYLGAMCVLHSGGEDVESAYQTLKALLSTPLLACFYSDDAEAIHMMMQAMDFIFARSLPALHRHFQECGVDCGMFAPPWFVTLFAKQLPILLAARIWDSYVIEGEAFILRAAVGVLSVLGARLREMEAEEVMRALTSLSTFCEVTAWDKDTPAALEKFLSVVDAVIVPPKAEKILWELARRSQGKQ